MSNIFKIETIGNLLNVRNNKTNKLVLHKRFNVEETEIRVQGPDPDNGFGVIAVDDKSKSTTYFYTLEGKFIIGVQSYPEKYNEIVENDISTEHQRFFGEYTDYFDQFTNDYYIRDYYFEIFADQRFNTYIFNEDKEEDFVASDINNTPNYFAFSYSGELLMRLNEANMKDAFEKAHRELSPMNEYTM